MDCIRIVDHLKHMVAAILTPYFEVT